LKGPHTVGNIDAQCIAMTPPSDSPARLIVLIVALVFVILLFVSHGWTTAEDAAPAVSQTSAYSSLSKGSRSRNTASRSAEHSLTSSPAHVQRSSRVAPQQHGSHRPPVQPSNTQCSTPIPTTSHAPLYVNPYHTLDFAPAFSCPVSPSSVPARILIWQELCAKQQSYAV
jgi:hypothetical protein